MCDAFAYLNGCYVETLNGDLLIDEPIATDTVDLIISTFNDSITSICILSVESAVARITHPQCKDVFALFHNDYIQMENPQSSSPTYVIAVYSSDPDFEKRLSRIMENTAGALQSSPLTTSKRAGLSFVFLQSTKSDKGKALERIAEFLRLGQAQTVAIGDGLWNDQPMLAKAGVSVAMLNANDALKSIASYVTKSNNNSNGVGEFLDAFEMWSKDAGSHFRG
jgi:hydroxymethylpyrimidine pyrophosphatase-like HAD family hydrolase